jgi:hypothetical protein
MSASDQVQPVPLIPFMSRLPPMEIEPPVSVSFTTVPAAIVKLPVTSRSWPSMSSVPSVSVRDLVSTAPDSVTVSSESISISSTDSPLKSMSWAAVPDRVIVPVPLVHFEVLGQEKSPLRVRS